MAIKVVKTATAPGEELEASAGKSRERDETQQDLDRETGDLVKEWKAAGGDRVPAGQRARRRYHVAPDDKAALKGMLRRAATLHKVEIVFLLPVGAKTEPVNDKGQVVITHTVKSPAPKKH